MDHDQGVLERKDRYERINKTDRTKQPDQTVRRCLSFSEIGRRHNEFICRISCHCDRRNQRHTDRSLLSDHNGDGYDQTDIQNQKQEGYRKKG